MSNKQMQHSDFANKENQIFSEEFKIKVGVEDDKDVRVEGRT